MKTTIVLVAMLVLSACDPLGPLEMPVGGDAGVVVESSSPSETVTLPDCSVQAVYATGICGVVDVGGSLRRCSVGCTTLDGTPLSEPACLALARHHYIHEAQNTTTNPSTWDDPADAVIGPVVCSVGACSSVCH